MIKTDRVMSRFFDYFSFLFIASLVGAPRVLQALAKDKLYPLIHVFEKGKKKYISILLCFLESEKYLFTLFFQVMELIKIPSEDIFWSFAFRWDVF